MAAPDPSWKAGPLDRRLDPNEEYHSCEGCEVSVTRPESYRCQGAAGDTCLARVCEGCKTTCCGCGLPVCSQHIELCTDGEQYCHECIAHWKKCQGKAKCAGADV
jgi:hypothetical protein